MRGELSVLTYSQAVSTAIDFQAPAQAPFQPLSCSDPALATSASGVLDRSSNARHLARVVYSVT